MTNFKECPFCGGKPFIHLRSIRCDGCNVRLTGVQSIEENVKEWNTRHNEDPEKTEDFTALYTEMVNRGKRIEELLAQLGICSHHFWLKAQGGSVESQMIYENIQKIIK